MKKSIIIILLILSIFLCFAIPQVNAQSFSSKTSNNPALEGVLEEIENKKAELINYEKLLTQQVNNDEEFKAKHPNKVKRIQCMKKRALKFIKRAENVEPKKQLYYLREADVLLYHAKLTWWDHPRKTKMFIKYGGGI